MSTLTRLVLGIVLAALIVLACTVLTRALYSKILQSFTIGTNKNIGGNGELGPTNPLLNRSVVPEAREQITLRELLQTKRVDREVLRLKVLASNCSLGEQAYLYIKTYIYDYIEKKRTDYILRMAKHSSIEYANVKRLILRREPALLTCYMKYIVNLTSLRGSRILPGLELALPHLTYLYSITSIENIGQPRGNYRFYYETDVLTARYSLPVVYESESWVIKPDKARELLRDTYLVDEITLGSAIPRFYLTVPDNVKPYLEKIVKKIRSECGYGTLSCVVKSLWDWITSRYVYSRDVKIPNDVDPIIYILTRGKQVNCLLANLIALLVLRMLNIPARLAVGYIAPVTNNVAIVMADYGHAWVEIFVPSKGDLGDIKTCYSTVCGVWIPLDFTPPPSGKASRAYPTIASIVSSTEAQRQRSGGSSGGSGSRGGSKGSNGSSSGSGYSTSGYGGGGGKSRGGLPIQRIYVIRGYCNVSRIKIPTGKWRVQEIVAGKYSNVKIVERGYDWVKIRVCAPYISPPVNETVKVLLRAPNESIIEVPVLVIIRAKTRTIISKIEPSIYLAPGDKFTVIGRVVTDRDEPVRSGEIHVYVAKSKHDKPIVRCMGTVHESYFNVTCRLPRTIKPDKYIVYATYAGTSNYLSSKSDPVIYVTPQKVLIVPECVRCVTVHKDIVVKARVKIVNKTPKRVLPELRDLETLHSLVDLMKTGRARLVYTGPCVVNISDSGFNVTFTKPGYCTVTFVYSGSPEYAYTRVKLIVYSVRAHVCINDACWDTWTVNNVPRINLTRGVYVLEYHIELSKNLRQNPSMLCLYPELTQRMYFKNTLNTYCVHLGNLSGKLKLNLSAIPPGKYNAKLLFPHADTIDYLFEFTLYRIAIFRDVNYHVNNSKLIVHGLVVDKNTGERLNGLVCVRELNKCSLVVNGTFNMSIEITPDLNELTLTFRSFDPYTLSRPYTIRLSKPIPILLLVVPIIVTITVISSMLICKRLSSSRKGAHRKESLALRYFSDKYYVNIIIPDIEPDMPPIWSTDRPLRVNTQVTTRDGITIPCDQVKVIVDSLYESTGCEHVIKFPRYGNYKLKIYVNSELVAEQSIRVVDYRAECERLYNMTVLEYAKRSGVDPEQLTPRQLLERLSNKLSRRELELVTEIFEIARYSNHEVTREHFVNMVRALRRLGFKVY